MNTKIRALAATALAGSVAVGSMAAMASPAAAAPGTKDCGPIVQVVCTKTWDRATTDNFDKTLNAWWFPTVRKLANPFRSAVEGVTTLDLPKAEKERAINRSIDKMIEAVSDAHDHQGCLQAKWRKDKKNAPVEWTYTTGSDCRL